jgi:hypothetical protein
MLASALSLCKFHFNASTGTAFHELKPEIRQERIARVEEWWKENRNRTLTEGIRSQLPHAEFYTGFSRAKDLSRADLSRETECVFYLTKFGKR